MNKRKALVRIIAVCVAMLLALGEGIPGFGSGVNTASADGETVEINETNFPDPIFRSVISGPDYDKNGDGVLDAGELGSVINIYCEGMGITSLKGVEYFVNLEGLWCKDNAIATMDLTNNKELHGVWCSGNLFTSLDFSANPKLEWVYCYDCQLTSLNVSANPDMAFIECNTNPLKTLDVTHNPKLEHLTCGTCELTSLDLSNNPKLSHLDAFQNKLTKLDVTGCPKLKRLDIWANRGLGSVDVSKNTGLQYYNCAYNDATSVDVSKNKELQKLSCGYNQLTKLDVSGNPKLFYLDCCCNEIGSLDLSNNPQMHFLQAFTNAFTTLNIGGNPLLVKTYKEGVKKAEYDVCKGHSWTLDYGGETSTGGDNLYFLCFDDSVTLVTESSGGNSGQGGNGQSGKDNSQETGDFVTREKVAQTLYEMEGKPGVDGLKSRFKDVKEGKSYTDAVLWGEQYAICFGTPDISSDTFGVGQWISRQDLALMLMRYSEYKGYKRAIDFGRSDDFIDYYDIDQYAWEAITWAITWDIMEGKGEPGSDRSEQRIDPHGNATRDDFEHMLKRLKEVNKDVVPSTPTPTKAPTKAPTATPEPTKELTKTPDPTATATPKPTKTPTPEPTETPAVTPTTAAVTPSGELSGTPSGTPEPTASAELSGTPTDADLTPGAEPTGAADLTPGVDPTGAADLTPGTDPTGAANLTPGAEPTPDAENSVTTPAADLTLTPGADVTPSSDPSESGKNKTVDYEIGEKITEEKSKENNGSGKLLLLIAIAVIVVASGGIFVWRKKRSEQ